MTRALARELIERHRVDSGSREPGDEIKIRINQTLTQDATGTLVMLTLEALGLGRVQTQLSAQYVDHNLLQTDNKNADDHLFLESACRRWGIHFSRPGNGISHPLHMQCFGVPGGTLLGSDSHTCAAGSLGMLAIGTGGLNVAMAMAGEAFSLKMPAVLGVRLEGTLPEWVSAKDVILELLRRHGVRGAVGRIIEYHGPGVASLSAMDRHVIANMGAELGATTSVFPSDERTREFLASYGREDAWTPLAADPGATYDQEDTIDLGALYPLIAEPRSPGNVVPVRSVEGRPIYQAYIGSSANPGFRDFAIAAQMVAGRRIADGVSFDINPTSRALALELFASGHLASLLDAGARLHQAGCNGCIGMGQAPATGRNSLRTTPRNFPGRSGTPEDSVWLCSPETAAASALTGRITDPRDLGMAHPSVSLPAERVSSLDWMLSPTDATRSPAVELVRGPNIAELPDLEPLPDHLSLVVALHLGDDISTDEILPAGAEALAYRSNIPRIAEFAFRAVDAQYVGRAIELRDLGGHAIVAGANYGQGSSREHAALAPRHLGLRLVFAKSFSRIHFQNLVNFGVLPLVFHDTSDFERMRRGSKLAIVRLRHTVAAREPIEIQVDGGTRVLADNPLSPRETDIVLAGGLVNWFRSSERERRNGAHQVFAG